MCFFLNHSSDEHFGLLWIVGWASCAIRKIKTNQSISLSIIEILLLSISYAEQKKGNSFFWRRSHSTSNFVHILDHTVVTQTIQNIYTNEKANSWIRKEDVCFFLYFKWLVLRRNVRHARDKAEPWHVELRQNKEL